jgi:hypothetical protein
LRLAIGIDGDAAHLGQQAVAVVVIDHFAGVVGHRLDLAVLVVEEGQRIAVGILAAHQLPLVLIAGVILGGAGIAIGPDQLVVAIAEGVVGAAAIGAEVKGAVGVVSVEVFAAVGILPDDAAVALADGAGGTQAGWLQTGQAVVAGEVFLAVVGALAGAPQAGAGQGVVLVLDHEIAVGDIDGDAVGAAAEGGIAGDTAGAKGSEIQTKAVAGDESDHGGFLCVRGGTGRHRQAGIVEGCSGQKVGGRA